MSISSVALNKNAESYLLAPMQTGVSAMNEIFWGFDEKRLMQPSKETQADTTAMNRLINVNHYTSGKT